MAQNISIDVFTATFLDIPTTMPLVFFSRQKAEKELSNMGLVLHKGRDSICQIWLPDPNSTKTPPSGAMNLTSQPVAITESILQEYLQ